MMKRRVERVNELLKEVISNLMHRSIQFPDETLITITRVVTSPDLHYARAMVTVYAANGNREKEALALLHKTAPIIQRALNKKLRMRPVPKISFLLDDAEGRRERVEKLLQDARKN